MTRQEFQGALKEHKWPIGVVGLAITGYAVSLFVDDLRGKVDVVALLGTVGGLFQMWMQRQTKETTQAVVNTTRAASQDVTEQLQGVVLEFGSGLESLRRDFRRERRAAKKMLDDHRGHADRLTKLEDGHRELMTGQRELSTKFDRLASQLGHGDPNRCFRCGAELPPLGQVGHNVRAHLGREEHFCDGCNRGQA